MSDKYELLRESLHELQREASARGGNNPRSQMILDLLADHEALQAECDRLNSYYKNGIDCFANPCEMHSGERTPPFSEFFERYGGRCLICVVDNNKALKSECEKLEAELATARAGWQETIAKMASHERPAYDEQQQRIAKLEAINLGLTEALEALLEVQDEGCRYDHEGYCQSHNLDHVDDGCRVAKAKAALAAYRKLGGGS